MGQKALSLAKRRYSTVLLALKLEGKRKKIFVRGEELTKVQLLLPRLPVVLDREWNISFLPRISFHRSVRNLIAIFCQVWSITQFKDVNFFLPIHVSIEKKTKNNVIGHT